MSIYIVDKATLKEKNKKMFAHHPPKNQEQIDRYSAVRAAANQFADTLVDLCPQSAELTLAIRAVEEAMMRANQSIAVNETE